MAQEGRVMADRQFLDNLDQETVEWILRAFQDADFQIRRAKRVLRSRVLEAVKEHRDKAMEAARPQRPRGVKEKYDLEPIVALLKHQPITYDIIKELTGLNDRDVAQIITSLSLEYPLWNPARGIYELLR
jgi:hypothetical protein